MTDASRGMADRGAHFGLPAGGAPRPGAFKAASRHSARVRWLRRAIVGGCVLSVAAILGMALFDPFKHLPVNISIGHVGVQGTRVTVDSPKMAGLQADGRPFEVKARSGIQDILTPNIVELLGVDAKLRMADTSTAHVTASNGVYDSLHDSAVLKGAVRIKSDAGYDIKMKIAEIDFKTGALVSNEPVHVDLDSGMVEADQMNILDNGHKITFEGGVKSTFQTGDQDPAKAGSPAEASK
ncbi:MAG TPA: LPS export ABC transporter periplasmic protein LptC [Beijerinckia sp.]|jgi:lipopolysaccharide export system protein LptC|nr:LPS export ABC transporter periplasmic protein LptC [Beijerinckia sp.]